MLTPLYAFGSGKTTKAEFFKTATCVSWDNSLQEKKNINNLQVSIPCTKRTDFNTESKWVIHRT